MLRTDLRAAGIDYIDGAGRYADFHALRHSTGSLLAASGVHPKVAQSIMRHSDINLTMSTYAHTYRGQESEAVEGLPDFSPPDKRDQKALGTGTDGKPVNVARYKSEELTPKLTPTPFSGCNRSATIGSGQESLHGKEDADNCPDDKCLGNDADRLATLGVGENEMGRGGLEPPTQGFSVPCSTT